MADQDFIAEAVLRLEGKFDRFQGKVEERLDEGSERMSQLEFGMRELNQRERERNGQVHRLTEWMQTSQLEAIRAAERAAVKAQARQSVTAIGRRAWGVVEKPVLLGLCLGILAGTVWATETLVRVMSWT